MGSERDREHVAVRVVARMGAPFMGDPTLPLDGALLYHAALRAYGEPPQGRQPNATLAYHPKIVPLATVEYAYERWFYACSFAQFEQGIHEGKDHLNKRFDAQLLELSDARKLPNTSSGHYKARHDIVTYYSAPSVTWYALTHDIDALRELLGHVAHLGKKSAIGYGAVLEWQVEEIADDLSLVRDGRAMRALPVGFARELGATGRRAVRTLCPPYWQMRIPALSGGDAILPNYTEVVF